jgi:polyhydroxyalkanoate synthesis regulator phasin
LSFESIKDAALDALEDSGAKNEVIDLLSSNKDLFIDEAKGYLQAVVSTFSEDQHSPEKYAEMVAIMDDEQLVAEVQATTAEIQGIRATVDAKKKFLKDLKSVASAAARQAIIVGLSTYVGPAAGPIVNYLLPGGA